MSLVQAVARVLVDPDGVCRFRFDHYQACKSSREGGSCHACGTPIADVFWFKNPDGRMVKLGKDCVRSTYEVDPTTRKLRWTHGDLGARAAILKAEKDKRMERARRVAKLGRIFLERNPMWGLRPAMQNVPDRDALPSRRLWRFDIMRDDYASGLYAIESGTEKPMRWGAFTDAHFQAHIDHSEKLGWNEGADLRRPPTKLSDFAAWDIDIEEVA